MVKRLGRPTVSLALVLLVSGAASPRTAASSPTATASLAPVFLYLAGETSQFSSRVVPIRVTAGGGSSTPAVPVGSNPLNVAITPDGRVAYVAGSGAGTVTPILTATNKPGKAIRVGSGPTTIAITPDGKTAYVADDNSSYVTPINTATNTAGRAIPVGAAPNAMAITPDGKTAYVANLNSNNVTPINTATNTSGRAIRVGTLPYAIAITPDGRTAYVANNGSGSLTPINTITNTAGPPVPVGSNPVSIAITPGGKTAYAANLGSDSVTPVNTATNTAGRPIPVGGAPDYIAITPNGQTAYVANESDGTVTPINTSTDTAGKPIPVGLDPVVIVITPNGETAYVGTAGSASVTPINTTTNAPGKPIPVSVFPSSPSFNSMAIPSRIGLVLGQWAGTAGPGVANADYGYPYPNPPACTPTGSCIADKWHFFQGQCTSWVAYRINQLSTIPFNNYYDGSSSNRWGPASNWGPHAQSLGIPVDKTPTPGSIAWYSSGHVAYVEWVNSSTSVVISEMNYDNDNGFRIRTITTTNGWPTDFIHIPGA